MRESSKIEKTKLPGDTYEGWLKTQSAQPERGRRPEKAQRDSYEEWIGRRVEIKARDKPSKRKRAAS